MNSVNRTVNFMGNIRGIFPFLASIQNYYKFHDLRRDIKFYASLIELPG